MGMPTALLMRRRLREAESLKPMILRAKVLSCNPSSSLLQASLREVPKTYVKEAKVEGPEYQEHADCEEYVGRLTKGSPLDDWPTFSRWQARSE